MATHEGYFATGNRLIDALPEVEARRFLSLCEPARPSQNEIVYWPDKPISRVYFPTTAVYGDVIALGDGRLVETLSVGSEGALGGCLALGIDLSPVMAVTQVPGESLSVSAATFLGIARPGSALDSLLRRYLAYCLRNAKQMAACNAIHSIEKRACRRLLAAHDRAGEAEFTLTQESLAEMLGARRQTITLVAQSLQSAGLIRYQRGTLKILNRQGLKAASCECYDVARRAYDAMVVRTP